MTGSTRTINAVDKTCRLICALQELDRAGVTELAIHLDETKSSIHAYLATLERNGFVVRERDKYRLSLRYVGLGEYVKTKTDGYDIITSEIENLAEETEESAKFATVEQGRIVTLCIERGEMAVKTKARVGSYDYMHCTGVGKAMLSQMPDKQVDEIIDEHGLPVQTENTIDSIQDLYAELADIRERGYAVDNQENITGVRCVAAPILFDDGSVHGAVSVSGPSSRMTPNLIESDLYVSVIRTANIIQINTKFSDLR